MSARDESETDDEYDEIGNDSSEGDEFKVKKQHNDTKSKQKQKEKEIKQKEKEQKEKEKEKQKDSTNTKKKKKGSKILNKTKKAATLGGKSKNSINNNRNNSPSKSTSDNGSNHNDSKLEKVVSFEDLRRKFELFAQGENTTVDKKKKSSSSSSSTTKRTASTSKTRPVVTAAVSNDKFSARKRAFQNLPTDAQSIASQPVISMTKNHNDANKKPAKLSKGSSSITLPNSKSIKIYFRLLRCASEKDLLALFPHYNVIKQDNVQPISCAKTKKINDQVKADLVRLRTSKTELPCMTRARSWPSLLSLSKSAIEQLQIQAKEMILTLQDKEKKEVSPPILPKDVLSSNKQHPRAFTKGPTSIQSKQFNSKQGKQIPRGRVLSRLNKKRSARASSGNPLEAPIFQIQPIKEEYLYVKSGHRWKRRWVILDSTTLYIFKNHEDLNPPQVVALMGSAVKKRYYKTERDKKMAFDILTAANSLSFHTENEVDLQEWVNIIQLTCERLVLSEIGGGSGDNNILNRTYSTLLNKSDIELAKNLQDGEANSLTPLQRGILEIAIQESNRTCVDCGTARPEWASVNLGVFICINCSGIHRSFGTHISKVRSVKLDTWEAEYLEAIRSIGNQRSNAIWEHFIPPEYKKKKIHENSTLKERREWLTLKYVDGLFKRKDSTTATTATTTAATDSAITASLPTATSSSPSLSPLSSLPATSTATTTTCSKEVTRKKQLVEIKDAALQIKKDEMKAMFLDLLRNDAEFRNEVKLILDNSKAANASVQKVKSSSSTTTSKNNNSSNNSNSKHLLSRTSSSPSKVLGSHT